MKNGILQVDLPYLRIELDDVLCLAIAGYQYLNQITKLYFLNLNPMVQKNPFCTTKQNKNTFCVQTSTSDGSICLVFELVKIYSVFHDSPKLKQDFSLLRKEC